MVSNLPLRPSHHPFFSSILKSWPSSLVFSHLPVCAVRICPSSVRVDIPSSFSYDRFPLHLRPHLRSRTLVLPRLQSRRLVFLPDPPPSLHQGLPSSPFLRS